MSVKKSPQIADLVAGSPDIRLDVTQPPARWRRWLPRWLRGLLWADDALTYHAFLSYSWAADSRVAPVIQSVLQQFLRPWYRIRALNIFRDLSSLPAGMDLEKEIRCRLDRSTHLIVLASPEAATSNGMEMEASYWLRGPRNGTIVVVVTKGSCRTWPEVRTMLLPPSLQGAFESQPLWIDLAKTREAILSGHNDSSLRGRLTEELKQLILLLYPGTTWESLRGEERATRRLTCRLIWSAIATLTVALAVATWQFNVANGRRIQAERASVEASTQASELLLTQGNQLGALLAAMRAGSRLNAAGWSSIDDGMPTLTALQQAVDLIQEKNRFVHDSSVTAMAISRDGTLVAAGCKNATIVVRRIDGTIVHRLPSAHTAPITSLDFSPDGRTLASGSLDDTIILWNLVDGSRRAPLRGHSKPVTSLSFSSDGSMLASSSGDNTIALWSADGHQVRKLTPQTHSTATDEPHSAGPLSGFFPLRFVNDVVFSPDGQILAAAIVGLNGGVVRLWNREGQEIAFDQSATARCLRFSPDGQFMAVATDRGTVDLRDISGRLITTLTGHDDYVPSLSFSADGRFLAVASDRTIKLWELTPSKDSNGAMRIAAQEVLFPPAHRGRVVGIAFSPTDATTLISASSDATVRVWRRDVSRVSLGRRKRHRFDTMSIGRDGTILTMGSDDGVSLWNLESTRLMRFDTIGSAPAFTSDTKEVVMSSVDDVQVWTIQGKRVHTFATDATPSLWTVQASPTAPLIAAGGSDGKIRFWNRDSNTPRVVNAHLRDVRSLSFSPDGNTLASASEDASVKLWSAAGRLLKTFKGDKGFSTVTFSRNGRLIAASDYDGVIHIWNPNGDFLARWKADSDWIKNPVFGLDDHLLASGGVGGTIRIWRPDGTLIKSFEEHNQSFVVGLEFGSNGRTLISGGDDGSVFVRRFELDPLMRRGCEWLKNYLQTSSTPTAADRSLGEASLLSKSPKLGDVHF